MELILLTLMITHGAIHFLGFIKGFRIAPVEPIDQKITRPQGAFWLLSGSAFIVAAILLASQYEFWWVFSLLAIIISQYLIIKDWRDARFGTIANVLILAITVLAFVVWSVMSV
ncbi:MAG: hypothetical protein JSU01_03410 [Bacteroidetes bacterium]|nr:hypothetical protein [Bacteroidota bacterium]